MLNNTNTKENKMINEMKRLNEATKNEAIEIMGDKDTLGIRQHLTKRDLKKLAKKLAKIINRA